MIGRGLWLAVVLVSLVLGGEAARADESLAVENELPTVPVGEDAYLMWDQLPRQRIGVRAYMRSTYDRTGGNRDADASHFLYQEADDFNVVLDTVGPGVLYFVRTNHHHGSPWHYEIDGDDLVVKETATDNPVGADKRLTDSVFIPTDLFPKPLVWTWPTTKGADLMWRPVSFTKSFRLAYERTFYGTGYFIYHQFPLGATHLSQRIATWDRQPPDPKVLELLDQAGTDIGPQGDTVRQVTEVIDLPAKEWTTLPWDAEGPAVLRALKFRVKEPHAFNFGKCRLRITWDHRLHPSIDAPLDMFFGAGQFHNDDGREYLVRGLPLSVRYRGGHVELGCYWPMPYGENVRIELFNPAGESLNGIEYEIRTVELNDSPRHVCYFHATYSDHPHPVAGRDVSFLDTAQVEGGGPWSGHFVGMTWTFTDRGNLKTLEGDPRFFFDGSRTPQAWGTGTEEWGGGGDYWGGRNMTLPLAGHPVGKEFGKHASKRDLVNSAYRFLIADVFPFGNRAVIGLEHGGGNTSTEHYAGVAYWYGAPGAALVETDHVNVCHEASIEAHDYQCPTAEAPYELVSRYEWGPDANEPAWWHEPEVDADGSRLYFPAEADMVRIMRGTSEFTVKLDPDNLGVLLRRKFDYQYPNQRANVFVRHVDGEASWQYAGEWYTAGSNTSVHSRPQGGNFSEAELAPTEHNVITSNRRWREEEFLIAHELTDGVEQLQIRIEHVPVKRELHPGHPFPVENAWSESRYWVYCYQLPEGIGTEK